MSDLAEDFRAMREAGQKRRMHNRQYSAQYLKSKGIIFMTRNNGAHLIVDGPFCPVDFWPGTGRWVARNKKHHGFGVQNLVKYLSQKRTV